MPRIGRLLTTLLLTAATALAGRQPCPCAGPSDTARGSHCHEAGVPAEASLEAAAAPCACACMVSKAGTPAEAFPAPRPAVALATVDSPAWATSARLVPDH